MTLNNYPLSEQNLFHAFQRLYCFPGFTKTKKISKMEAEEKSCKINAEILVSPSSVPPCPPPASLDKVAMN